MRGRVVVAAAALDVAAVVGFVALGRRSHDSSLSGTLEVAAPFLIALAVAWAATRAWRRPLDLRTGLAVWGVTSVLGLALRGLVFDRGLATAFVIVALLTTLALIVGWRAAARALGRPRSVV